MRRDNKYEKILSVAARLISNKGYEGVSLQEIGDKVGLHKSSLFHYIKSKDELLLRIFEKSHEGVIKGLEVISNDVSLKPQEKLQRAIENHLTGMAENFDPVNIFFESTKEFAEKEASDIFKREKEI